VLGVHWRLLCRCGAIAAVLAAIANAGAASQKKIVADFEDFGTWRMKESSGLKPGAWWPAEVDLAGSDADKDRDDLVGELKFSFDPQGAGPFRAGFERSKMSLVSGFLDGIEWDAKSGGLPVSLQFQIQDASGKLFTTHPVALSGGDWRHYRLGLDAANLPGFANCKFPARLKRITVEAASPCEGRVFLDDVAITGTFAKQDRLSITPVYDGLAHLPGQEVALTYRLRSTLSEKMAGDLKMELRDFEGNLLLTRQAPFSIGPAGEALVSWKIGSFPLGAYEVRLMAKTDSLEVKEGDHFVVMEPNNGRPNQHPMWFGIQDTSSWQGDLENRRHLEWMHLLGADIDRVGFSAEAFEPVEGLVSEAGWRRIFDGHAAIGMDVMLLYGNTPRWTHSQFQWRHPPDLYPKFEEHAARLAGFLKEFPNVKYLEFWNEPDLDFFQGTLGQYLEMFRHFAKGFRKVYPGLPFATGGVTVMHPREKPGFSQGLFQQAGDLYDIAAYHAHGPLINTEVRQKQVVDWLNEAGLGNKHLFNTETGERSLYNAEGRRRQAITLVKKVVFSKAQPNFDAYFWFTLQDYWDMDPEADDSFGLVTSDNRAKPSFAAYNALIRQLANTSPVADSPRAPGVALFAFRRDDGRYVYAGWPDESATSAVLWVKTAGEMEVSDIFGLGKKYAPLGGVLPIPVGDLPLYISGAAADEPIEICSPDEEFVHVESEIRYADARQAVSFPVVFRNPSSERQQGSLRLADAQGREIARQAFDVAPGESVSWSPEIVPAKLSPDAPLRLDLALGKGQPALSFPSRLIESYMIRKAPDLGTDPASWPPLESAGAITIDRPEQVFELAYDPNTPAWKGPQDLSATARVVHDSRGIRFRIAVTDDVEGPVQKKDELWRGDDVQVAFGRAGAKRFAILDLGRSADGPVVWCSDHGNADRIGQWNVPLAIKRQGSVTTYDVYLPYDQLGFTADDKDIRFSFLVNENDGKGRIRWMEWKPGIARDRSMESLGYGRLE